MVAADVQRYLHAHLRPFGHLELPCVLGRDTHARRARNHQAETFVDLTVAADDDVELMRDYGIRTMQNGRIARVIEEAYYQDALLDGSRLQLLFMMNHKAELVACNLEYIAPDDWQCYDRDQVSSLKWERLKRLATQAFVML